MRGYGAGPVPQAQRVIGTIAAHRPAAPELSDQGYCDGHARPSEKTTGQATAAARVTKAFLLPQAVALDAEPHAGN